MHDAYIGGRSENNIKCIVHDDLGWKNRTAHYCNNSLNSASAFDTVLAPVGSQVG